MHTFECPECGHRYRSRKALENAPVRCAHCGHKFRVTVPRTEARDDPLASLQQATSNEGGPAVPPAATEPSDAADALASLGGNEPRRPEGPQTDRPADGDRSARRTAAAARIPKTRAGGGQVDSKSASHSPRRPRPAAPPGAAARTQQSPEPASFLPDDDDEAAAAGGTPVGHPNAEPAWQPAAKNKRGIHPALVITPILVIAIFVLLVVVYFQSGKVWVDVEHPVTGAVIHRGYVTQERARELRQEVKEIAAAEQKARHERALAEAERREDVPPRAADLPGDLDGPTAGGDVLSTDARLPSGSADVKLLDWEVTPELGSEGASGVLAGTVQNMDAEAYKRLTLRVQFLTSGTRQAIAVYETWCYWVPPRSAVHFSLPFSAGTTDYEIHVVADGEPVDEDTVVLSLDSSLVRKTVNAQQKVIELRGPVRNDKDYGIDNCRIYAVFMDGDGQIVGTAGGELQSQYEDRIRAGGEAYYKVKFDLRKDKTTSQTPLIQTIRQWEVRLVGKVQADGRGR